MPQGAIEWLCAALLVAGCLLGGSGAPERPLLAVPELIGVALLVVLALIVTTRGDAGKSRWLWLIAAVILGLPALQLVPLPAELWARLPGRAPIAAAYGAAGLPLAWLPISLTPRFTEQIGLALLPAVALFLCVPHLPRSAQRRLTHVAIGIGVLDVVLGFAQIAGGPESPLRFYESASRTDAVGLFANRNHQATFLSMLVVLGGALFIGRSKPHLVERVWLAGAGSLLLLGIAASGSRAGLALGLGACIAVAWAAIKLQRADGKAPKVLVWGGLAAIPMLIGAATIGASVFRLQTDSLAGDLRWQIARTTWHAIAIVFPVGGGFGSFERLYAQVERPDELIPAVINHVHDDWLEVTLEGGLPAALLLVGAIAYLVRETFFRKADPPDGSPWSRAMQGTTLAALWLCAVHSIVDFPLRTMAVNLVLALACGLRATRAEAPTAAAGGVAAEPRSRTASTRHLPGAHSRPSP